MSVSTTDQTAHVEQIERLVDTGFEAAVSCLTMWQAWTKVALTAPLGYSAATEAANLLARAAEQGRHGQRAE